MELTAPPVTRPAEHLLRAHLAHTAHLGQLSGDAEARLRAAASSVGEPAPAAAAAKPKPRRRSKR